MCEPMDAEVARSRELDKQLRDAGREEAKIVKLLLLGTGMVDPYQNIGRPRAVNKA